MTGIPLRIDCGTGDPFYRATRQYISGLSTPPAGEFQPGDHNMDYWQSIAPAQLAFIGAHLPEQRPILAGGPIDIRWSGTPHDQIRAQHPSTGWLRLIWLPDYRDGQALRVHLSLCGSAVSVSWM